MPLIRLFCCLLAALLCCLPAQAATLYELEPDCIGECCKEDGVHTDAGSSMRLVNHCFIATDKCPLSCKMQCVTCPATYICYYELANYTYCKLYEDRALAYGPECSVEQYRADSHGDCNALCYSQGCLPACSQPDCGRVPAETECARLCGGEE